MRIHTPLEEKLYAWLQPLAIKVGLDDVIFTDQNGPTLEADHMVVNIIAARMDSPPERGYRPSTGDEAIEVMIYRGIMELGIQVFSNSGAIQQAEEIKARIWGSESVQEMGRQNIGLNILGPTTNTSAMAGPQYEQRADFTANIHYLAEYDNTSTDTQGVGGDTIGTVTVIGADAVDGEIIVDKTISDT